MLAPARGVRQHEAVAVAEYLRREIEREPGESAIGIRVRVHGSWEHGYLSQDVWAIRASRVERLESE